MAAILSCSPGQAQLPALPPPLTYQPTMEAAARCTALGIPSGAECNADAILEAAQHATDPALWVEKVISTSQAPPHYCRDPVLLESSPHGESRVYGCQAAREDDTFTDQDLQRILAVAERMNATPVKNLRQHLWAIWFRTLEKPREPRPPPPATTGRFTPYFLPSWRASLLPEAAPLCTALGIPLPGCNLDTIGERAEDATDRRLWIATTVTGEDGEALTDCLDPIPILEHPPQEGRRFRDYACHAPDIEDTISAEDIADFRTLISRLNADRPKTLAKHSWMMDLKRRHERAEP